MYLDERLYSTGNYYLDDILEKAFSEGYDYAIDEAEERYYSIQGQLKKLERQRKKAKKQEWLMGHFKSNYNKGKVDVGNTVTKEVNTSTAAGQTHMARQNMRKDLENSIEKKRRRYEDQLRFDPRSGYRNAKASDRVTRASIVSGQGHRNKPRRPRVDENDYIEVV